MDFENLKLPPKSENCQGSLQKVSENVIISNFSLNCYFIIIVINSNINIFILFKKIFHYIL